MALCKENIMQVEILKQVVSSIAGERAKGIIDLLHEQRNVNEFLIAKKLKMTINQTRNILYKLADEGLVSFVRKKDSKKGGWYIYFWTLNPERGMFRVRDELVKDLDRQKQQLESKKKDRFYFSPNCNLEFTENEALMADYTCPECGEILQLKDNSKDISAIEKDMKKNEELLQKVNSEVQVLQVQGEKIKIRKLKAEEKKKKVEREERKKLREKEAKKVKRLEKKKQKKKR